MSPMQATAGFARLSIRCPIECIRCPRGDYFERGLRLEPPKAPLGGVPIISRAEPPPGGLV